MTAHIIPFPRPSLQKVLAEIREARRTEEACWAAKDSSEAALERHIRSLDRLDSLTDEARRMVEAATGVSWNTLLECGL